MVGPRLPFVRTCQFYIPAFATAEDVVLGQRERCTRTYLVVALQLDVEVQFGVIGLVQCQADVQVECVGDEGRVAWGELHFQQAEDAHIAQTFLHTRLFVKAVEILGRALAADAGAVLHLALEAEAFVVGPAVEHVGAYAKLVVVVDAQALVVHAVVGRLAVLAQDLDGLSTQVERFLSHRRHTRHGHHAHADVSARHQRGVGLVSQVVGAEVVAAYVAQ